MADTPVPGRHAPIGRDHEYKRHGTLSLLAGIDLLSGEVLGLIRDRHRSREFVEFLSLAHQRYPAGARIRLVLDNHSANISRETAVELRRQKAGDCGRLLEANRARRDSGEHCIPVEGTCFRTGEGVGREDIHAVVVRVRPRPELRIIREIRAEVVFVSIDS